MYWWKAQLQIAVLNALVVIFGQSAAVSYANSGFSAAGAISEIRGDYISGYFCNTQDLTQNYWIDFYKDEISEKGYLGSTLANWKDQSGKSEGARLSCSAQAAKRTTATTKVTVDGASSHDFFMETPLGLLDGRAHRFFAAARLAGPLPTKHSSLARSLLINPEGAAINQVGVLRLNESEVALERERKLKNYFAGVDEKDAPISRELASSPTPVQTLFEFRATDLERVWLSPLQLEKWNIKVNYPLWAYRVKQSHSASIGVNTYFLSPVQHQRGPAETDESARLKLKCQGVAKQSPNAIVYLIAPGFCE